MRFAQICDRVEVDDAAAGPFDLSALPGTWVNSNPATSGIARMSMTEDRGRLSLRVYGVGPEGVIDWGAALVEVFAATPASRTAAGFACVYDFGFAEARLQGMMMKGLLVLAQFHRFRDASGRADYFLREYFALDHGRH